MSEEKNSFFGQEVELGRLLRAFCKRAWLIILCAGIGLFATMTYVTVIRPDTYTASAIMYVHSNNPNQVNYQYVDQTTLNAAKRLTETYMVVIRSNKVMDAVAARLGYMYDPKLLASAIQVASVSGTEVMRISVTTGNPTLSMEICNAVAEFAPAEIIRVVNAGQVEVIDYASLPEGPDSKNIMLYALVGFCAGALVAGGIITILFLRDRHVRADTDLAKYFEQPVLANVPRSGRRGYAYRKRADKTSDWPKGMASAKVEAAQSVPPKNKSARFIISERTSPDVVEVYKMLRTNLNVALKTSAHKVLLMVSAIPSEGKSTASANLAIVSAQENRRVLLIDADMRKPSQHKYFGVQSKAGGLSEILAGFCNFREAVRPNIRPGLDLLTAGMAPPNPIELLNSPAMRQLLEKLRGMYDLIIIDTPPINVVADSLVLATQAAGALMVTRRDVSDLEETQTALQRALQTGMNIFGLILVDARGKQLGHYHKRSFYYHEYGIGYQRNATLFAPAPKDAADVQRVAVGPSNGTLTRQVGGGKQ